MRPYFSLIRVLPFLLSGMALTAHESRPAYLEITQKTDETYAVLWKVPARSPEERLGLRLRFPEDAVVLDIPRINFQGGGIIERFTLSQPGGLAGREIHIEGLSRTLTDVLVRVQSLDASVFTARLSPDAPSLTLTANQAASEVAKTYTILGIQHILDGVDHLLFVACLVLIAGRGRKLLVTITGFTLAHSITLALATLDIVTLPVPPVEATIALSIVFLAREIARGNRDGLTYRFPVAVSVSFGLLHGFGFAAVLAEIGLPRSDVPLALLFFNVGVEIGQLLFIAALLGLSWVVVNTAARIPRRLSLPFHWQPVAAYAIGMIATYWTLGRVARF